MGENSDMYDIKLKRLYKNIQSDTLTGREKGMCFHILNTFWSEISVLLYY